MKKLNIGQRLQLTQDMKVSGFAEGSTTIPKGTVLFVGADKKFFYLLNGKMIRIGKEEYDVANGFSVTGLAEWVYQRISGVFEIDEMLEEVADYEETGLPEQVERFKQCIGMALEEIGFYDHTGNTT